jgi:hypothetical protein
METLPAKADRIHMLTQFLHDKFRTITVSYLEMGAVLRGIRDNKLYLGYASHIKTMNDYLKEICMPISTGYQLMLIHERFSDFIEDNESYKKIQYNRLVKLLPFMPGATTEQAEGYLQDALDLPNEAFLNQMREMRGLPTTDGCEHDKGVEIYERCKNCGKYLKIGDTEHEHLETGGE